MNKRAAALADRCEVVKSYTAEDLGAELYRCDGASVSADTSVILMDARNRKLIVRALRLLAAK